ncbi:MAG: lysylphosphatidylglycerol synthase transmembrane domain-containing protein [Candidatus Omnitrophota bacterium]|nr:lysylphosphatidylglycerol synthase transmembrane domain-containing protein [Candidatus Omnitrophota bacterium]
MKKTISTSLRIFISLALLFVLFRKIDFKGTLKVIANLNLFYFTLALVIFFILTILVFYRWKMLLDAHKVDVPLMRALNSFSGGLFLNLFTPSTIGGDLSRSIDLGAHTKRYGVIAATVLLDRLSGFAGLVTVAIVSLIFGHRLIDDFSVYATVSLLACLLIGVFLILFNRRIYDRLNRSVSNPSTSLGISPEQSRRAKKGKFWENFKKLHSEIYFFRQHRGVLCANFLYSIVIQAGASVFSYFVLRSLNTKISLLYPLVFNPVITVITTIPISISGLGLRDAATVFFYKKADVSEGIALALSILNFTTILIFGLIGGILYVSTLHYRRLQPNQTDARAK